MSGPATDPADKLVRMANQIAAFFRAYPEEEAVAGVRDHVAAFWSPVMRRDLLARALRDPAGIDPLVLSGLEPVGGGASPARREAEGPATRGEIGASDAG